MEIVELLKSSILQFLTVLALAIIIYFSSNLILSKKKSKDTLKDYLGLRFSQKQFDNRLFLTLTILIIYAVVSTYLQFRFSPDLKAMILNESSPYYKILKNGFSLNTVVMGVLYCFIQAGGSEELLFRGLIGKRLYNLLGKRKGNIIQAILFWIMHLLIIRLMTGSWFSLLQVYGFITSFGLGLVCGWVNFRENGNGIFPSWLIHSSVNFSTFLTLAYLI